MPHLFAKAVQDYADLAKDDRFREYAAEASARFVLALMRKHFPPREPGRGNSSGPPAGAFAVALRATTEKLASADIDQVRQARLKAVIDRLTPIELQYLRLLAWYQDKGQVANER